MPQCQICGRLLTENHQCSADSLVKLIEQTKERIADEARRIDPEPSDYGTGYRDGLHFAYVLLNRGSK